MNTITSRVFVCVILAAFGLGLAVAQEHPGKPAQEHPGSQAKEHPGSRAKEHPGEKSGVVTAEMIRQGILNHITAVTEKNGGIFPFHDEKTGRDVKLKFVKVHDNVSIIKGKTYFACTDFKDTETGKTYDLDFWMKRVDGTLKVVETKIHKVDGVPRFTYKEDEIVPVQ